MGWNAFLFQKIAHKHGGKRHIPLTQTDSRISPNVFENTTLNRIQPTINASTEFYYSLTIKRENYSEIKYVPLILAFPEGSITESSVVIATLLIVPLTPQSFIVDPDAATLTIAPGVTELESSPSNVQ